MAAPLLRRGIGLLGQSVAQRQGLRIDLAVEDFAAFFRDGGEQLVGGIGEQPHALLDQLVGDGIERNSGAAKVAEHTLRVGDIGVERIGELAVVAERIHGRDRYGVDGVAPDQLLDIEHVAIGLVLGAGRSPQQPLRLCAFRGQRLPARAVEQPLVALIGELGIGDGDLAFERIEARFLVRIVGLRDLLVEQFIDRGVDAADEKARHAGDLRNVAALGGQHLKAGQIGFDHLLVDGLRKQQRDIDVDAAGNQIVDRRHAFGRAGHLDHQVLAADLAPQPLGFVDGALGILGEIGRDFDADIAVGAMGGFVCRAQHVGGLLDVLDRQMLENLADRSVLHLQHAGDGRVVFVGMADGLLEDRRVRRHPAQAVVIGELFQAAVGDKTAGQEIEPDGLAVIRKRL